MIRKALRAQLVSRLAVMMIATSCLFLSATAAQAIYVDLSAYNEIGTHIVAASEDTAGHELIIESAEYTHESRWFGDITVEMMSITFVDEPVALDSISLHFSDSSTRILANVMGEMMLIESTGPGTSVTDTGGIEGQKVALAGFGGTSLNLEGIEFRLSESAGTAPVNPGSPVPEPQAALLFSVALGVVAARRRF
ncbi:MAG: hypothetical protein JRF61_27570 [Deltaproteobacteria bacterium]|nr:hypothetical protein [Deltaproteobacteria bacterium]